MTIKRGLGAINKHISDQEERYQARKNGTTDGTRARWFSLKDKEFARVIFLQELDPDSKNYSQKNDIGFIAVEHANPEAFTRKALCSFEDEGACWACEKHRDSYKTVENYKGGWKQKNRLYINVLVDNGKDEPYVAILSQGTSEKQITPALIEQAGELGTITDKWFKIKRNGADFNNTSYVLTALTEHDKNVEDYELNDLDKAIRAVPYTQQEAHYLGDEANKGPSAPAVKSESNEAAAFASASGSSETW